MKPMPPHGARPGARAILTYHSIDPSASVISINEKTFERHIRFFASGRVRVLSLSDLLTDDGPGDAVALTFDDGFANFATAAWPRLREHGLPATVFVVCDRVGKDNRWSGREDPRIPTLGLLDWDQVGRLAEQGVEIGSHSRSHPRLDQSSVAALRDEIYGSSDDIARLVGRRPTGFCYPFGAFDERTVVAVAEVYRHACTTELHTLDRATVPHRLPRLDCYYFRRPGALEQWGTMRFRTRIQARAVLRSSRQAVGRLSDRRPRPVGAFGND